MIWFLDGPIQDVYPDDLKRALKDIKPNDYVIFFKKKGFNFQATQYFLNNQIKFLALDKTNNKKQFVISTIQYTHKCLFIFNQFNLPPNNYYFNIAKENISLGKIVYKFV